MAGVNTVAVSGEQNGDVALPRSGSGSLTVRFNEHSSAAFRPTGAAKDAGLGSIPASSRITLRRAVQIAAVALRDQEDPSGHPRILQVISVMNACSTEDERIVAVVYSAVESGRCTLEALRCEGLPDNLITAVDALTRRPGETDNQAAARAACHPVAHAVVRAMLCVDSQTVRIKHNGHWPEADLLLSDRSSCLPGPS